jgi:tetratricopeptide (TPR) repeat protein
MLFDLRGRGRRRTVRILYTGLALLMGVGLVGFGIGGGFGGGGILNAAENGGSGGPNRANEVKKYRKLTQRQPNNVAAWEKLTNAQILEAGGEAYLNSSGLTSKGRELFNAASESWSKYLALNPPKPSVPLAKKALRLYGEEALNQPAKAVEVLQIIVAGEPGSASYYSQLAVYAYKAKNARVGDLASQKAVALAPENQRTRLKKELEELKKTPGGKTYTTVTNGKTYAVKKAPNGQFTGTQVTTTPAPASTTGTTTTKK